MIHRIWQQDVFVLYTELEDFNYLHAMLSKYKEAK